MICSLPSFSCLPGHLYTSLNPSLRAHLSFCESTILSQVLISVKNKCIMGEKLGILSLWHSTKGISWVPWWFHYHVKRNTIMIGLLCEHQSLTCLNESYKSMRFAVLLYVSIASSQHEFCIIYCFSAKPFFNVQWHYTSDFSSRRPCLYFCPSLPPSLPAASLRPSVHPSGWGEEW